MKKNWSTAVYVAASIFAAYASYELMTDVGSDYQLGVVEKALGGLMLFAVLTGALWATIAQIAASAAIERGYSWRVNIVRLLGFVVGMGAGTWGMAGALNDMPGWKVGCALAIGFVGISAFGFATVFAPSRALESTASD